MIQPSGQEIIEHFIYSMFMISIKTVQCGWQFAVLCSNCAPVSSSVKRWQLVDMQN